MDRHGAPATLARGLAAWVMLGALACAHPAGHGVGPTPASSDEMSARGVCVLVEPPPLTGPLDSVRIVIAESDWPRLSAGVAGAIDATHAAAGAYRAVTRAGCTAGAGRYAAIARLGGSLVLSRSSDPDVRAGARGAEPPEPGTHPVVRTDRVASDAGRDALDEGADLVITADPRTIAYAATLGAYAVVPLPVTRMYALLVPPSGAVDSARRAPDSAGHALRVALASDAVHADAVAADSVRWSALLAACGASLDSTTARRGPDGSAQPGGTGRPAPRIVYPRDDSVARGLSERLVALTVGDSQALARLAPGLAGEQVIRAAPLDDSAFVFSLITRRDAAYVWGLPLPPRAPATRGAASGVVDATRQGPACQALAAAARAVPWLAGAGAALDARLVPLVATRSHAIVRRTVLGLAIDTLAIPVGAVGARATAGPPAGDPPAP